MIMEMKKFLAFIKNLINNVQLETLEMGHLNPEIILICSQIFDGKVVSKLDIHQGPFEL